MNCIAELPAIDDQGVQSFPCVFFTSELNLRTTLVAKALRQVPSETHCEFYIPKDQQKPCMLIHALTSDTHITNANTLCIHVLVFHTFL